MVKTGVIGLGRVGKELARQITARHWDVIFAADSKNIYRIRERFTDDELVKQVAAPLSCGDYPDMIERSKIDILFMATPSNLGQISLYYAYHALKKGVLVVTCEKAFLSDYFTNIKLWFDLGRIGYSATVGGGTMMLSEIQKRLNLHSSPPAIYAVLNGTLNFLFGGGTIAEALKLGLTEPGANDPIAVVNAEIKDTARKAIIIHNTILNARQAIDAKDISITPVTPPAYYRLTTGGFRYYVIFSSERLPKIIEGWNNYICFHKTIGRGSIIGGFFQPGKNEFLQKLVIPGANNAFAMDSPHEECREIFPCPAGGPGAGPEPTAAAMIKDAENLLAEKNWGCLVSYLP
ncbi:hypothetical protein A2303_05050 [Candidatus Falkowbacteria bacterium RIFOXYB2_FULL_47_14]|uniref:Homoserine dehydrogenase n=1 Tax=Candidatus Falkowbacteria bacterium RIFOXYA2_FULL_47_19 TaxID=1797994 RepID=A0A1F5SHD8_9BACT|nr:MAG: hypothetical protein A2227_02880 [Candidatus Falkowbacteria bacterium RIFOXYA2_FULL_47_19]OGF36109.1 MAG: hypothetical protein A2468_01615 [Candidatus Falkowbacteria bacterium RIFOXYC2_FULL_46_15]OGF42741.1 MAG: hypothetical protein A2303_05050 [Candidatus Falkowbacteria bacterium RIFOXYB2_FULL_47_14]